MCADAIRPWLLVFQVGALDFTFPGMNRAFDFLSCLYISSPAMLVGVWRGATGNSQ